MVPSISKHIKNRVVRELLVMLGFIFLLWVLYSITALVISYGVYQAARWQGHRLESRRLLEPTESREVNNIITDALAAWSPGKSYLVAGVLAATLPLVALPVIHWLYIVYINWYGSMNHELIETNFYLTAVQKITGYLPRVAINLVVLFLLGIYFAAKRRRLLRVSPFRKFLFWHVSSTEMFTIILGWLLYFFAAVIPYIVSGVNLSGMLTVGGGWIWLLSGPLISWYMHSAHNALLWALFRYRWPDAMPGIVKMMAQHRLGLPPEEGLRDIKVDAATGTVAVKAHLDELDAPRLHDDLLAVPGLNNPQVIPLGPLPGAAVRIVKLPPRMKPLPPRAFRRPEGPPKGYNAEYNLIEVEEKSAEDAAAPAGLVQRIAGVISKYRRDREM